jgi:hypothetical protein
MMRTILLLPVLLALAACDTLPKAPERQVVNVQIPVPCVDATIPVYKANRKVNEINGLPRPPPRQC